MRFGGAAILSLLLLGSTLGNAEELKPETLRAWTDYVANARPSNDGSHFLWLDETPERAAKVRRGGIVVAPVGENPKRVPDGLIHDWIGAIFISGANIHDVLAVVGNYDHYEDFYAPNVIDARLLAQSGSDYRFAMLLKHKALFVNAAIEGQYESKFVQVNPTRWYSVAHTTRMQQIDHYGEPDARKLPPDEGSGYLWRLYSIARFEQRDGGVYVEVEAIGLSRDIPSSVRWLADPVVRRLSKASVATTLEQTRDAVHSNEQVARRATYSSLRAPHHGNYVRAGN